MNYSEVVKALKPLEGHYVRVYAQPGELFVGEVWAEQVRYFRPEERIPHAAKRDCTVILWSGIRDVEGMAIGFVLSAARVIDIEAFPPDSFRLRGKLTCKIDDDESASVTIRIELWFTKADEPKVLSKPLTDRESSRYEADVVGYKCYLRRLLDSELADPNERPPDYDVRHHLMVRDGYVLSEVWFLKPDEDVPAKCHVVTLDDGYRMAFRNVKGEDYVHEADAQLVA